MKKMMTAALCIVLTLSMAVPAFAVEQPTEIEAAGAYLRERGVYQGDGSGDLMLDKGLTRAEMAAVLTRLHGEGEVNPNHYTWACYFTDVPNWAKGKLLPVGMMIALDYVWDQVKADRTKRKMVFIDEIWKLIGGTANRQAAEFCLEIFKIIRGYGGGTLAATQDLSDFFGLEDVRYGRAILSSTTARPRSF